MRINEILNYYPEQLRLWKVINDTVFTVLTQQAQQAANQQTASLSATTVTPKASVVKKPVKRLMPHPVHAPVKTQLTPQKNNR